MAENVIADLRPAPGEDNDMQPITMPAGNDAKQYALDPDDGKTRHLVRNRAITDAGVARTRLWCGELLDDPVEGTDPIDVDLTCGDCLSAREDAFEDVEGDD